MKGPWDTGYLTTRKPARRQYDVRTKLVTALLVHTAENVLDSVGPDTGAEAVAEYIRTRDTAGSYGSVVDSDSICWLGPPWWAFYHCRGGVNAWSVSVSFACRTTDWATMPRAKRAGFLRNGAIAAAWQIRWIESGQSPGLYPKHWRPEGAGWFPVRRINGEQARAGYLGITSHAAMDPTRRSDPGGDFPWDEWLPMVEAELAAIVAAEQGTLPKEDDETGDEMAERVWSLFDDLGTLVDRVGQFYDLERGKRGKSWHPVEALYWIGEGAELLLVGKSPEPVLAALWAQLKSEPK